MITDQTSFDIDPDPEPPVASLSCGPSFLVIGLVRLCRSGSTKAIVSRRPSMDVAYKGAALFCDAVITTTRLLLALPSAIARCAALDAGLWQPPANRGCTFYEGDVQHVRCKPLRHKFRSVGK